MPEPGPVAALEPWRRLLGSSLEAASDEARS